MAYYLGRDVRVYLTTEATEAQVTVASNAVSASGGGSSSESAVATASITFLLALSNGNTVTIINTAGTSKTYTVAAGDTDASAGTFAGDPAGGMNGLADGLAQCIAHANGHNGTITTSATATGQITLTQATKGASGNTTIGRSGWGNSSGTLVQWSGGRDGEVYAAGVFAENLDMAPALTKLSDLTGVDLGIGVTDEDITFMRVKTVLKAEIKKETTISLTRKKSNNVWDVVYNGPTATNEGWTGSAAETGDYGARWGVIEGAADTWYINNGLVAPKDVTDYGGSSVSFGYRVFIELKNGTEVISIPGCQLVGHTITLNADGTTEELLFKDGELIE